jgi:hypothetical protein
MCQICLKTEFSVYMSSLPKWHSFITEVFALLQKSYILANRGPAGHGEIVGSDLFVPGVDARRRVFPDP